MTLQEIMKKNEERKARLGAERKAHNEKVKQQYKLGAKQSPKPTTP